MLHLLACIGLTCGPGTRVEGDQCVATPVADPGTDSPVDSPADSATESDESADSPEDTVPVDSGETATEVVRDVWILAGQSNMDGYAYVTGLPPSWRTADARVPLYWSGWSAFRGLQPTSYGGSYLTGPEVSFGHTLADAGQNVALVKHAVGGTDLAVYWNPGAYEGDPAIGEGWYDLMLALDAAEAALDTQGEAWRWAGFVWMQGESDALDPAMAAAYSANLEQLISRIRAETVSPALPVVVGLISTEPYWVYAEIVREAQRAVADADPAVVYVETDDLPRSPFDLAHYDGPSNRVMGERFAQAAMTGDDVVSGSSPEAAMAVTSWATDYDFNGTCGWAFTVDAPVTITDIGAFAPSGYLYTSTELGVWDADGNLVFREDVPSFYEAASSWRSGFSYVAVDPVVLEPGAYRIGYVSWSGDGDRYGNDALGSMGGGVSFEAGVYVESYWLAYPSVSVSGARYNFVGPNMMVVGA